MAINLKRTSSATASNGINVRGTTGGVNLRVTPPAVTPFTPLSLPGLSFSVPGGSNFSTGNHYRNNVASTANPYNDTTLNIGTSQIVAGTLPGAAGLYNLDGKLAEILVYNAQHTNSERLQVTQYLAAKYGISI